MGLTITVVDKKKKTGLTPAGQKTVDNMAFQQQQQQDQVNTELQRRQLLIQQGLRQPSKLEQGVAQQLGVTPQQILQKKTIQEAAATQEVSQQIAAQPVETAKNIPIINQNAPNQNAAQSIPIIGEAGKAAEQAAQAAQQTNLIRKIKSGTATPDEIKQATGRFQLDAIDMEVIKAGEADISKMGQFVEAIPILPRELKKFVPLFSTPSKKVDEILANLGKTKDNIVLWSDLAKSNPAGAGKYIVLINDAETQLLRMESRIKIISIQSPEIQANPEEITKIMLDITNNLGIIQGKRQELQLLGLR